MASSNDYYFLNPSPVRVQMMNDKGSKLALSSSSKHMWVTLEVSPPRRIQAASQNENDSPELPILELKHFTKSPFVIFKDAPVGVSTTNVLVIHNPQTTPQVVKITRFPKSKGFTFDNVNFYIDSNTKKELSITWMPDKEGSIRETVVFHSDAGFPTQIVILASAVIVTKKKSNKGKKKCVLAKDNHSENREVFASLESAKHEFAIAEKGAHAKSSSATGSTNLDRRQTYTAPDSILSQNMKLNPFNEVTYCVNNTDQRELQASYPLWSTVAQTNNVQTVYIPDDRLLRRQTYAKARAVQVDLNDSLEEASGSAPSDSVNLNVYFPQKLLKDPIVKDAQGRSNRNERELHDYHLPPNHAEMLDKILRRETYVKLKLPEKEFNDSLEMPCSEFSGKAVANLQSPLISSGAAKPQKKLGDIENQQQFSTPFYLQSEPLEMISMLNAPQHFATRDSRALSLFAMQVVSPPGVPTSRASKTSTPFRLYQGSTVANMQPSQHFSLGDITVSSIAKDESLALDVFQLTETKKVVQRDFRALKNAVLVVENRRACMLEARKARKEFLSKKKAAATIQSNFRMWKARRRYLEMQKAIVVIQAHLRGWKIRKRLSKEKKAALVIEDWYRRTLLTQREKENYMALKNAAKILQRMCRGKKERERFLLQKAAAIKIQSVFRMWMVRKNYIKMLESVVTIQACFRGWRCCQSFVKQRNAAQTIVMWYKKTKAMHRDRRNYVALKNAALTVQRLHRDKIVREAFLARKAAAIKIQSVFRMFVARKNYIKMQKFAICIQAHFRGRKCRQAFLKQKKAVCTIAAWYKATKAMHNDRKNYIALKNAALTTQKMYRGKVAHQAFLNQKAAAIKIQSAFRMWIARKKFLIQKCAIIFIQSCFRGWVCWGIYLKQKAAAQAIAQWYKKTKLMHKEKKHYLALKHAAVTIQRAFRARKERQKFVRRRAAAVKIQSSFRMWHARKNYSKMRESVITIQAHFRGWRIRKQYRRQKKAALMIQSAFQMWKEKCQYKQMKRSAVVIQRHFRKYCTKKQQEQCAAKIQSFWRGYCARQVERKRFLELRRAVICIQALYRNKKRIAQAKREEEERTEAARQERAAIVLQAAWRSHMQMNSSEGKQCKEIRERLRTIAVAATVDKSLAAQTTTSLEYLHKYTCISKIRTSLDNLARASRLLPSCCRKIGSKENVLIICRLIDSFNRSSVYGAAISDALSILLNLAKFHETIDATWNDGKTHGTVFKMMKIYSGNNRIITEKTVLLMWLFCQKAAWRKVIKEDAGTLRIITNARSAIYRRELMERRKQARHEHLALRASTNAARESCTQECIFPDWANGNRNVSSVTIDDLVALLQK